jgi:hypothetical protein
MVELFTVLSIIFFITGILAILFSIAGILANGYENYFLWIALGGVFVISCGYLCTKLGREENEKRPVVVSTKVPPQIDTTITITNGVADTLYTYHLIKK